MFCTQCGSALIVGAKFCHLCGTRAASTASHPVAKLAFTPESAPAVLQPNDTSQPAVPTRNTMPLLPLPRPSQSVRRFLILILIFTISLGSYMLWQQLHDSPLSDGDSSETYLPSSNR